jgi:hypothetical protein
MGRFVSLAVSTGVVRPELIDPGSERHGGCALLSSQVVYGKRRVEQVTGLPFAVDLAVA